MASLSKLDIDDQSFSLYLLIQPNGDSLELRAFDGAESWTGMLTGRQMNEMAGKVTVHENIYSYSKLEYSSYKDEKLSLNCKLNKSLLSVRLNLFNVTQLVTLEPLIIRF